MNLILIELLLAPIHQIHPTFVLYNTNVTSALAQLVMSTTSGSWKTYYTQKSKQFAVFQTENESTCSTAKKFESETEKKFESGCLNGAFKKDEKLCERGQVKE
eukprot:Em0008g417a